MADNTLQCTVVTPERALLDEQADFVVLPMYDGELGVLPGRAPLVGRLGFGELRIVRGNETKRLYVDGGFVQIRNNVVTVLTSKAVKADELKPVELREQLRAAQVLAPTPEKQEAQAKAQERARAALRVAEHVGKL